MICALPLPSRLTVLLVTPAGTALLSRKVTVPEVTGVLEPCVNTVAVSVASCPVA